MRTWNLSVVRNHEFEVAIAMEDSVHDGLAETWKMRPESVIDIIQWLIVVSNDEPKPSPQTGVSTMTQKTSLEGKYLYGLLADARKVGDKPAVAEFSKALNDYFRAMFYEQKLNFTLVDDEEERQLRLKWLHSMAHKQLQSSKAKK